MADQHRGAPMPGLLEDLRSFVYSIPTVTRYLVFCTFCFSLGAMAGLCKPDQLLLDYYTVFRRFEVWRLFTAHFYCSGQAMIWHLFMLYQNSLSLENDHFASRPADYATFVLFVMGVLDVISYFFEFPILTESFGMAVTYMYAMSKGDAIVTFMFGMQFKAKFLPWVLIVFNMLMGGGYFMSLIGIAVGHLYYFLDVVYPQQSGGNRLLVAPGFISNWFGPPPNVMGTTGNIPNMGNAGRTTAHTTSSGSTRGYTWGAGNRLGSE